MVESAGARLIAPVSVLALYRRQLLCTIRSVAAANGPSLQRSGVNDSIESFAIDSSWLVWRIATMLLRKYKTMPNIRKSQQLWCYPTSCTVLHSREQENPASQNAEALGTSYGHNNVYYIMLYIHTMAQQRMLCKNAWIPGVRVRIAPLVERCSPVTSVCFWCDLLLIYILL